MRYRIVKLVSLPEGHSAEFYLTLRGGWVADKNSACDYNEWLANDTVERLNKKADRHYCNTLLGTYQITTYFKEEI